MDPSSWLPLSLGLRDLVFFRGAHQAGGSRIGVRVAEREGKAARNGAGCGARAGGGAAA